MKKRCDNCDFYICYQCRRYAPRPGDGNWEWPSVDAHWFCGDWKKAEVDDE